MVRSLSVETLFFSNQHLFCKKENVPPENNLFRKRGLPSSLRVKICIPLFLADIQ
jgi:hypothetical protein